MNSACKKCMCTHIDKKDSQGPPRATYSNIVKFISSDIDCKLGLALIRTHAPLCSIFSEMKILEQ